MTLKTITFGVCHQTNNKNLDAKNFIIFQAKYFIFLNEHHKTKPTVTHFKQFILSKIYIEKEIALSNDRLYLFDEKWNTLLQALS